MITTSPSRRIIFPLGISTFFLAFYEDHDGVAGNVKITDPFADPGMTALKDQFF